MPFSCALTISTVLHDKARTNSTASEDRLGTPNGTQSVGVLPPEISIPQIGHHGDCVEQIAHKVVVPKAQESDTVT